MATKTEPRPDALVPTSSVDHLTRDAPVIGQEFACVSFICPEHVLPRKEAHHFQAFLRDVFRTKVASFADAVKQMPEKVGEFADKLLGDMDAVNDDFVCYVANNHQALEDAFAAENPLKLSQAGFKVRGSYPTLEAARERAEMLQRDEPNIDVFVSQVGAWCPFNPSAESVGEVVYDDSELNTLMQKKKEADARRSDLFARETAARIAKDRADGASTSASASVPASAALATIEEDVPVPASGSEKV